jgi:hypothetical protein
VGSGAIKGSVRWGGMFQRELKSYSCWIHARLRKRMFQESRPMAALLGPRLRSRPRPGVRAIAVLRCGEWWAPRPGVRAIAVLRFGEWVACKF